MATPTDSNIATPTDSNIATPTDSNMATAPTSIEVVFLPADERLPQYESVETIKGVSVPFIDNSQDSTPVPPAIPNLCGKHWSDKAWDKRKVIKGITIHMYFTEHTQDLAPNKWIRGQVSGDVFGLALSDAKNVDGNGQRFYVDAKRETRFEVVELGKKLETLKEGEALKEREAKE